MSSKSYGTAPVTPWSFDGDVSGLELRQYLVGCRGKAPTRADLDRAVALGLDPGLAFSQMGWDAPGANWGRYHAGRAAAEDRYARAVEAADRAHRWARQATPRESYAEFFRATRVARNVFLRAVADALADALGLESTPAGPPTT